MDSIANNSYRRLARLLPSPTKLVSGGNGLNGVLNTLRYLSFPLFLFFEINELVLFWNGSRM
jgi:hypothetical protein